MSMNEKNQVQSHSQTDPSPDIHDRVAEAYYGLMGQQFMRETQDRIHWICRHVRGKSVVDAGCSQGLVPILLGREGFRAVGIDLSQKSIDEAKVYLANEPEQVQENISFVNADFLSWTLNDQKVDTVVMSEVLEHLVQPEGFIEAAARVLDEKGRLVVTVPFGINDFIDHKHTFYFLEPLTLISKHFDVVEVDVLGKWLGIVADRRAATGAETFQPGSSLIEKLERAFYQTERFLRDDLSLTRKRLEEANQKYRVATEQVAGLKQRVTQEETARRTAEQQLAHATAQLEQSHLKTYQEAAAFQRELTRLREQSEAHNIAAQEAEGKSLSLEAEIQVLRDQLKEAKEDSREAKNQVPALMQLLAQEEIARLSVAHEGEKKLLRIEAELQTVHRRLGEATQKYQAAAEQIATLKQRATQEEAARRSAEQALTHVTAQTEQVQIRFQEECTALQQQVAQLSEQVEVHRSAAHQAEKNLVRAEAEQDALRILLEDASQKYRSAAERGEALGIAAQEAERKRVRLEANLETVRARLEEANQKYRKATEQVAALKQRVAEGEAARHLAEQSLRQVTAELEEVQLRAREERTGLHRQIALLTEQEEARRVAVQEAEKHMVRLKAELAAARCRFDEADQQFRISSGQVDVLKQRLVQEETARHLAEQGLRHATVQAEQSQVRLEQERVAFEQQLAQLTLDGQAKTASLHEAEKRLIAHDAELKRLSESLDDANRRYRQSDELATALQQRLTQEEEARLTAERRLIEATGSFEQAQARMQDELSRLQRQISQLSDENDAHKAERSEAGERLRRLSIELDATRGRVEAVSRQYQAAEQNLADLKKLVAQEESSRRSAEQELESVREQLQRANNKYRHVTGREIPELKSKLEAQHAKSREVQHTVEQLRLELRKEKKALSETTRQLEQVRQQRKAIDHQLAKTRATISFQFGYLLIHGFKSFDGFMGLPSALWALRKEAVRRRKSKTAKLFPPPLPAVTQRLETEPLKTTAPEVPSQAPLLNKRAVSSDGLLGTAASVAPASSGKLNIACIMDEFTFGAFQPEAVLHQLTPDNWKAELEAAKPDLLFIESAWRGKEELWGNKIGHTSTELQGVVEWCVAKKVPTVFWNKEDPIHFETFLTTAKLFDYVFTTDIDCIHRYKSALGHDRVYLLPFACQPTVNNPIETYRRKDAFCFAGAYYVRYAERTRDLRDFISELPAFRPVEIYDRNFGKSDPNYQFPEEYRPYIVGTLPFEQIDKAYKGYRYAINLNSIKQSQTMFARRVFELLASNTITISNFSRGVRLLFGDLVISSDSGEEIVRRLKKLADNEVKSRKLRLAALRKVMQEHTYGQRLAYVVAKVTGKASEPALPHIAVLAYAMTKTELEAIQANYQRQTYTNTSLYVVVGEGIPLPPVTDARVHPLTFDEARNAVVDGFEAAELIAGMVADDYYGPNYLQDIALATRYTQADLIGKAARYCWENQAFEFEQADAVYREVLALPARAAAIRRHVIGKANLLEWVQSLNALQLQATHGVAIDEFNYCRQGTSADQAVVSNKVDDLPGLNTGVRIDSLLAKAERIPPERKSHDGSPSLTGKQLSRHFDRKPSGAIQLRIEGESWRVDSALPDGKHEYLYATVDHTAEELGFTDQLKIYLDVTPGLNIQLVVLFLDGQKHKISHVIKQANRNHEAAIPPGTVWIRFGLRFYAGGTAEIKGLVLGQRNLQPADMVCRGNCLVLTNHYPTYDDLYRNAFVHSRVKAYLERGVQVDVFRLRANEAVSYHEFEDVDVITGPQEVLHQMLSTGQYNSVLVHFLDPAMWEILQHHIDRVKAVVWIHGAEIQPWHRRDFNHVSEEERAEAMKTSDKRMAFWRGLLQPMPRNLKLVFVSRYFAEEVMSDLGFRIAESNYVVIHNPIDTVLFNYVPKNIEQRKKVLSIRPYSSRVYANDLSMKAIQILSKEPWFYDMEFRMIGEGRLFEETLAPLREFRNVHIEQRFLKQSEIAALHKEYGVFLCPTRMDSQGVSRDEAMSSGLVPVTNAVAAVPEFLDEESGILAPSEDAEAMAQGIARLFEEPETFAFLSNNAARRVRRQSCFSNIIQEEVSLFAGRGSQFAS